MGKGDPKGGRPLKEINWKLVDDLCAIQATGEEIAGMVDVDYDTLNRRMEQEFGIGFTDYFAQKRGTGKISLRRSQYQTATVDKNPTMQIWLGKQWLGQTDKSDLLLSNPDGTLKPTVIELVAYTPPKNDDSTD